MDIIKWNETFDLGGLTKKYREEHRSSLYDNVYILNSERYIIVRLDKPSNRYTFLGKYGKFYEYIWYSFFFDLAHIKRLEDKNEFDWLSDENVKVIELSFDQNRDIQTIIAMFGGGLINEKSLS